MSKEKEIRTWIHPVADPGGGAKGAIPPPPVPDKDYLLCTSWHFLVKNPLDQLNNEF